MLSETQKQKKKVPVLYNITLRFSSLDLFSCHADDDEKEGG